MFDSNPTYYRLPTTYCGRRGQLLLEILVVVAAAVIILGVASQLLLAGVRSNKNASDSNVALSLAAEEQEAVRNAAAGNWLNLYNLQHDGTAYFATTTAGAWALATGTETSTVNSIAYNRSFVVQHICRTSSTAATVAGLTDSSGNATSSCTSSGGLADPSTQKVTVSVVWASGGPVSTSEYITRWRNKTCVQSAWTSASSGAVDICPSGTDYETSTNVSASSTLQLCAGGC